MLVVCKVLDYTFCECMRVCARATLCAYHTWLKVVEVRISRATTTTAPPATDALFLGRTSSSFPLPAPPTPHPLPPLQRPFDSSRPSKNSLVYPQPPFKQDYCAENSCVSGDITTQNYKCSKKNIRQF